MKEKIIKTSIELFNERGFVNVSMKQIADALGISASNLSYHFKRKSILLSHIYNQMSEEAVDYILPNTYLTLHHFEELMQKFYEHQQKYSFFAENIVDIIRSHPEINQLYHEATQKRLVQARSLIDYYIETERLRPEDDFVNYDQLIHVIWMVSTFWPSQTQIAQIPGYEVNKCQPIVLLWNLILPLLTDKGKEEYIQIRKYMKLSGPNS